MRDVKGLSCFAKIVSIAYFWYMAKQNKSSKPKKARAAKYDEKLSIEGNFADVFKVVKQNKEQKKKP